MDNPYEKIALFPKVVYGKNEPSPCDQFNYPLGDSYYGLDLDRDWSDFARMDMQPMPPVEAREGYANNLHYFLAGINDLVRVQNWAKAQGLPLAGMKRTLDFGCGTGRFLRNLLIHHPHLNVYGCDLNQNHIDWVTTHLGPSASVLQNTILPHLPFRDGLFDLVTAFSIFSHTDEFELMWIAELARITAPQGLLYITFLSEETWKGINSKSPFYEFAASRGDLVSDYPLSEELFRQPMPSGKVVFRYATRSVYSADVFLSDGHIQREWGKFLNIHRIERKQHDFQDVVIASPRV